VQERPLAISRRLLGVDFHHLRAEAAGANSHRPAHNAPHPIAPDDCPRPHGARVRADEDTVLALVVEGVHPHAVPDLDPPSARRPGQGVVEIDPSHDPPDPSRGGSSFGWRGTERDPVNGNAGHVHVDADSTKKRIASRTQGPGAGLVARIAGPLEQHCAPAELRGRMSDRERCRRPGWAASHDDDVSIE